MVAIPSGPVTVTVAVEYVVGAVTSPSVHSVVTVVVPVTVAVVVAETVLVSDVYVSIDSFGLFEVIGSSVEDKYELSEGLIEVPDETVPLDGIKPELLNELLELADVALELAEGTLELSEEALELAEEALKLLDGLLELAEGALELP